MTSDLITRLSKLDAPDREVDALIAAELEPHIFDAPGFTPVRPVPSFRIGSEGNTIRFEDGGIMCLSYFPRYTASVDAVIALAERVLPGFNADLDIGTALNADAKFGCRLWRDYSEAQNYEGEAFNSATALCIALLRAKEASKL